MARTTTTYDIVLSCPTDVEMEREVIKNVIDDFNRTIGNNLSINLNLKHWSTDSFAQSGEPAQDLLNKQFIDDADMIICIFWGRMGTPTESYESGTAEEMLKAIEKGKQVFLYFSNAPIKPNDMDIEQLSRVNEFRGKVQDMQVAYYKTYNDLEEFKSVITTDLNLYFIQMNENAKKNLINQQALKSNLVISGIKNKKRIDTIKFESIYSRFDEFINTKYSDIQELFQRANKIEITSHKRKSDRNEAVGVKLNLLETTPYEYPEAYIKIIKKFSEDNSIILNKDFFEVGDLSIQKNLGYMSFLGGSPYSFVGSQYAKDKQKLIQKLYLNICEYSEWVSYSQQFQDIGLVRLALSNQGTIFETDITVFLKFAKKNYIPFEATNPPGEHIIKMINEKDFIKNFFGDVNSVDINSYSYPERALIPTISAPSLPGYTHQKNYEEMTETYYDDQKDLQCYEEYEIEDDVIQKYIFKELKQFTNISFPTVLLFNSNLEALEIGYEIISKESPTKKQGVIKLDE